MRLSFHVPTQEGLTAKVDERSSRQILPMRTAQQFWRHKPVLHWNIVPGYSTGIKSGAKPFSVLREFFYGFRFSGATEAHTTLP